MFWIQDIKVMNNGTEYVDESGGSQLVQVQKNESIIERSFDKLKETTTVRNFAVLH